MSFAEQLAARAAAQRRSSGATNLDEPSSTAAKSPSIADNIKSRSSSSANTTINEGRPPPISSSSSSSTTRQSSESSSAGFKRKQKKKLVPIPDEDNVSGGEEKKKTFNTKQPPQDKKEVSSSSSLPTTTAEETKRMSFGSAIKAKKNERTNNNHNSINKDDHIISTTIKQSTKLKQPSNNIISNSNINNRGVAIIDNPNNAHVNDSLLKQKRLNVNDNSEKQQIIVETKTNSSGGKLYRKRSSSGTPQDEKKRGGEAGEEEEEEEEEKLLLEDDNQSEDGSFMTHDEIIKENVRLTQLLLDIGQLEELEKLRRGRAGTAATGNDDSKATITTSIQQKIQQLQIAEKADRSNNHVDRTSNNEKDAMIGRLQNKLAETESELKDVTALKNAEIAVLRKQLDRAEHKNNINSKNEDDPTTTTMQDIHIIEKEQQRWHAEREGLRDEIRRLNVEISMMKEKYSGRESSAHADKEELLNLTRQYSFTTGSNGGDGTSYEQQQKLDSTDIESLQSIIAMMRQTIDQTNNEKEVLEQRLAEEQERSQMELQAFARTLEGVDDLRQSAESMSREIRRIKVKGYRPTRSDLFSGGMGTSEGRSNFGELSAAVEASTNMEDAIRLIESQNDACEERRRMGVIASSSTAAVEGVTKKKKSHKPSGLGRIDDEESGGFLSFWNRSDDNYNEEDGATNNLEVKEKKKKAKRKKKKNDGGGSVLTSFF